MYSLFQQIFAYGILGTALDAGDTTMNKKKKTQKKPPKKSLFVWSLHNSERKKILSKNN